jgi:hypothetical protein
MQQNVFLYPTLQRQLLHHLALHLVGRLHIPPHLLKVLQPQKLLRRPDVAALGQIVGSHRMPERPAGYPLKTGFFLVSLNHLLY